MTEYEFIPNTSAKEIRTDLYIFISHQWRDSQTIDTDKTRVMKQTFGNFSLINHHALSGTSFYIQK